MAFDPYFEWLGIPPDRRPPTHYDLLGLEPGETDAEKIVHAADETYLARYRRVRAYAADPRYGDDANRLLDELATARLCLSDPERKADYDRRQRDAPGAARPGQESPALSPDDAAALVGVPPADASESGSPAAVDLDRLEAASDLLDLLPEAIAWEHAVVPLALRDGVLWLASSDPAAYDLAEKLRFALARPVRIVEAPHEKVRSALVRLYRAEKPPERAARRPAAQPRPALPAARYCPHCGKRLLPKESICLACAGQKLVSTSQQIAWQRAACRQCGGRLGFAGIVTCPHCQFDHALGRPPKRPKIKPVYTLPFAASPPPAREAAEGGDVGLR